MSSKYDPNDAALNNSNIKPLYRPIASTKYATDSATQRTANFTAIPTAIMSTLSKSHWPANTPAKQITDSAAISQSNQTAIMSAESPSNLATITVSKSSAEQPAEPFTKLSA